MRKLFGIFILSVACCMIAGADMLLFAKTETYQLMFFGGYAVSALLLVLLGLLCARDRRLYSLGMTLLGASLVMWSSVAAAAFLYSSHKWHARRPFDVLEVFGNRQAGFVVLVFQTLLSIWLVWQFRKPEEA